MEAPAASKQAAANRVCATSGATAGDDRPASVKVLQLADPDDDQQPASAKVLRLVESDAEPDASAGKVLELVPPATLLQFGTEADQEVIIILALEIDSDDASVRS